MSSLPLLLAETSSLSQLLGNVWLGVQVALGLGFVIFVHELGHFLAAKTFGVRATSSTLGLMCRSALAQSTCHARWGNSMGRDRVWHRHHTAGWLCKNVGGRMTIRASPQKKAKRIRLGEGEAPLDPRSYPAKPVWQRMIIISAGVVMNLIFAVILAAAAYWVGVPYPPTVAGSTYAGGPAWEAGIQTGDQVVKLGDMKDEDPHI
ncbi:MAG: site-2 protease family protein [Pirellulaceae bacterium]